MGDTWFYRVENDLGEGPYVGKSGDEILGLMASCHNLDFETHPTPHEEASLARVFRPEYHACGTSSIEQLMEWFDGYGDDLSLAGYRVNVYKADVTSGRFQAIAPIRDLTPDNLVETFSCVGL